MYMYMYKLRDGGNDDDDSYDKLRMRTSRRVRNGMKGNKD